MPKIIADEAVYAAVVGVVAERGYTGATTAHMAAAADMSEVTLFRRYGSKEELIQRAVAALPAWNELRSASTYTGDIRADLSRVVTTYRTAAVRNSRLLLVIFSEIERVPNLVHALEAPFGVFSRIGDLLGRYQDEGVLRPEAPMSGITALFGPLVFSTLLRSAFGAHRVPDIDPEGHVDRFLQGRFA